MSSSLIHRTDENQKDDSIVSPSQKNVKDSVDILYQHEATPPNATNNKGFGNRVPTYTKSSTETSPSLLDTFSETSHIRESRFWGFSKFMTVTIVYWMISNLYRQYCEKETLFDKEFIRILTGPFFNCIGWWCLAIIWSINGYLNIYAVNRWKYGIIVNAHRWFTESIFIVGIFCASNLPSMGMISMAFVFASGNIYLMKVHSYMDVHYDLFALNSEETPYEEKCLADFLYFLAVPSLVYEPSFPTFVPENRMHNIIVRSVLLLGSLLFSYVWITEKVLPIAVRLHRMPVIDGMIYSLIPMWVSAMVIFFTLFELVCNILADITCYGDRSFYGDWWNSTTFEDFNRLWNKPVHQWLLRHVYFKVRSKGCNKFIGQSVTLLYSSLMHEFALYLFFSKQKIRVQFFTVMMVQPILFTCQNKAGMKGTLFGNYLFWLLIIMGISLTGTWYGRLWAEIYEKEHVRLGWLREEETLPPFEFSWFRSKVSYSDK